ncbi:ATP-binding cassette domain-containing protein [bacterium]|nr:ATP-binding cassette domain-containing protein [bacterium]
MARSGKLSSETGSIISFKGVSAHYKDQPVLNTVSFDVHMGDFIYLVGRTGSGKSTLLKLIYADLIPLEGVIRVGDYHLNNIKPRKIPYLRRKMGVIFQDFQLLFDRNVYQNIRFALRATGWREGSKMKKRITEVLMKVGMAGKSKSMPHQLSGGEQQRVAIARSLINDPVVLIADEPTGNLDPEAGDMIMQLLRNINDGGTAVIMATHEYTIIKRYPSKVIQVDGGKIIRYEDGNKFLEDFWKG